MRAADVRVGATYTARVNGRFATVRIDRITSGGSYEVTNLATNRTTVFRSAAKFRSEVVPVLGADLVEGEQSLPFAVPSQPNPNYLSTSLSAIPMNGSSSSSTSVVGHSIASRLTAIQPTAATGLTQQQQDILAIAREIESATGQRVLVIKAGAGTGKTFTLKQLEGILRGNGQYTARNTKLVGESKAKFVRAACNTTHSLAFRAVGYQFAHRLRGKRVRSWEVAQRLGIQDYTVELPEEVAPLEIDGRKQTRRLKAAFLARQVMAAIQRFCVSADAELGTKHIHWFDGIDAPGRYDNSNAVKEYLLPFMLVAWADLSHPRGTQMPFGHDVYVKLWSLDRPVIAADYILLDEGQDTAPVMLSVLEQQTHAMLIMVGDDNQQIYEWAGAVNALSHFRDAPVRHLSQSFRFGQAVADVANSVLAGLEQPTTLVMTGSPSIPSRICAVEKPRCYLYRTNAGAIGRVLRGIVENKKGYITGPVNDQIAFCKAALELQAGRGTTHAELGCFEKWSEVEEYSKEEEGSDLRLMVKLIKDFGANEIVKALERMPPDEDHADFVCSTAHRSKGLEWTSVRLGEDFKTADKLTDEERRLLYVACTRAQEELDLTVCPTFCGGNSTRQGGTDDSAWVPGIAITYTVDMPTTEQLVAYRTAKLAEQSTSSVQATETLTSHPAPARPTAPAPSGDAIRQLVAGSSNRVVTYTKLQTGDWGLWASAPILDGEVVEVRTRNGSTKRETVDRVVYINEQQRKWLATIRR